jgi:RHH-type proline utilization regulon transcriptional repressor/proline dehydrogenase/delta 1-pyrroline-5-carboxylate dehydrogenase
MTPVRKAIAQAWLADETVCAEQLLQLMIDVDDQRISIESLARNLITRMRNASGEVTGLDAFLAEYDLSSHEGIVLMCLAEALLRIPDNETVDRLIQDKLAAGDWESHIGQASSLLVNAGSWGLMLTGRIVRFYRSPITGVGDFLGQLVSRSGEPLIRAALKEAMRILGFQFVMGQTIEQAIKRSRQPANEPWRYSFDMLGEAAMTMADAERYYSDYVTAIQALARTESDNPLALYQHAGLSIKLSALHPRFEFSQSDRWREQLIPRVVELARLARKANISLTLDAEEADRLEPMLEVFEALCHEPDLHGWQGLGLAVQAYQKRAIAVIDWLADLAGQSGRRLMVRLVKGAYWDTEIKRAQERGLSAYPVYTRKVSTDVSYLACARRLLQNPQAFYPQFATHNAHTVAAVLTLAQTEAPGCDFEFQRLHGMGGALYKGLTGNDGQPVPCRVYAPVGKHDVLLAYLVRRLLENGANSSFVNRMADEKTDISDLIADPVLTLRNLKQKPHPSIPLPQDLFALQRRNSSGINLHDAAELEILMAQMQLVRNKSYQAAPIIGGQRCQGSHWRRLISPNAIASINDDLGQISEAGPVDIERALTLASHAFGSWSLTGVEQRALVLEQAADLFEQTRAELITLIIREGGRCVADAIAEVRETVDYCRYYAAQARTHFVQPQTLAGPTGESNTLGWAGRGVFVTISPWNFPLAIFTGQVVAALAAGNSVIAKPASLTPLTALRAVELLHQAGVPVDNLHYLPCPASEVDAHLLSDPRVAGVAVTGSMATAMQINQRLASRSGAIVPLIAETGGINAMIIDSTALLEQAIADVISSAFNSAGQRCSALRVLYIQDDIAEQALSLLQGAMHELRIGNPALLATDIGPLIESQSVDNMHRYCQHMEAESSAMFQLELPAELSGDGQGCYFPPTVFEIEALTQLKEEIFGPILHVIRFGADQFEAIINDINCSGYGLTLGLHSRIARRAEALRQRVHVGNIYVNRNIIGASVGVQPFGGEGLSGTGPKAGGPHTLYRFATERCLTINTAAMGGNASLLALTDK